MTLNRIIEIFEQHAREYEEWFDKYPEVFRSEVEALRTVMPLNPQRAMEIGLATGRFSEALGIQEGAEPAFDLRRLARLRGIKALDAFAENLPYRNERFDVVLMAGCISYFENITEAFKESYRILKKGGKIIVGFISKDSNIANYYESKRLASTFYRDAKFYSPERIADELRGAGFARINFSQTLFGALDEIHEFQPSRPGFSEGSFVVIGAWKDE